MDNILTKLGGYLSSAKDMTRPERRCLKNMVTGILKSRPVFVNQVAASLREPLKLKDVAKRLSAQYLKGDYADKVLDPSGNGRPARIEERFHRHGRHRHQNRRCDARSVPRATVSEVQLEKRGMAN